MYRTYVQWYTNVLEESFKTPKELLRPCSLLVSHPQHLVIALEKEKELNKNFNHVKKTNSNNNTRISSSSSSNNNNNNNGKQKKT
ncbi:MAG: hypothetical protein ACTSUE_19290 [Promethearchaeota archaeon]